MDLANHALARQEGMLSQMVANTQGCGRGVLWVHRILSQKEIFVL